jgi:Sporulation protein Cse60
MLQVRVVKEVTESYFESKFKEAMESLQSRKIRDVNFDASATIDKNNNPVIAFAAFITYE